MHTNILAYNYHLFMNLYIGHEIDITSMKTSTIEIALPSTRESLLTTGSGTFYIESPVLK